MRRRFRRYLGPRRGFIAIGAAALFWAFLSSDRLDAGHGRDDDVDNVTAEQVKFFLDAGEKIALIDLRPAAEFKQRHLPKARSIPLSEMKQRLGEVPRAGRVILYCDCRPADEAEAFFLLRDNGYRNVAVLQNGFTRWLVLKYPVESSQR